MGDHTFEVRTSETLYTGKILALRADDVVMPGGRTARREVVEHFGAVAVVALDTDPDGRPAITLVRQYRQPLGRRLWELPAGLLDIAGEPAHEAAARELVEEVGLAARDWSVLVDVACSPGFSDESVRIFLATGLSHIERPPAHDEEADMEVRRVPLAEAVQWVFTGTVNNAAAISGILAAQAVSSGIAQPRPLDADWPDRPTRFAERMRAAP